MATRRKANTPTQDMSLIILAVGVAGFFAAMWFGLPAVLPLWVAGLVAAWTSVAVNPDDEKSVRRHRYAKDFQTSLILPIRTLININQASWITSILVGTLGYLLPDAGDKAITAPHGHLINAVLALIISLAVSGARSAVLGSDYPGLPLTKIRDASKSIPLFFIGVIAGFGLATAAIYELNTHGPKWGYPVNVKLLTPATQLNPAVYSQRPSGIFLEYPTAFLIVVAALTGWVFFVMGWGRKALADWKELSASREAWNAQWLPLKKDPPPRLIERSVIDGILTIETFQILPHETVTEYLAMEPKFAAMTGTKVATLSAPVDNNQPGTWSPVKFTIAQWSDMPDVTSASAEITSWWIRSSMAWTVHTASVYPEPVMSRLALISEGDDEPEDITQKKKSAKGWWTRLKENSPTESTLEKQVAKDEAAAAPAPTEPGDQLWVSNWNFPPNCASWYMREEMLGTLISTAQCEAAIDNRSDTVYFGVLEGESVNPRHATILEALATQDRWRGIWQNALKSGGANAPRAQAALALSANLASGVEVNRMPFTVNEGKNPAEYRDVESTLKTALGGAKFVAITGWPDVDGNVGRPGDRHPQALCVYWSMEAVPSSPSKLEPSVSPANQWVLAGIVNDIFRTLKMAHPEVTAVRPLTKKKSAEHIWEISLRLYGDVTTSQVRKNGPKIAEMLAIPWVRVTDAENGCTLYLGAKPTDEILSRERDRALVASLDWEQAFLLTSVLGSNGAVPQLISTDHLPSNEMVQVLDFSLPPGLDKMSVRMALSKLRAATGNAYIEVLDSLAGPTHITIQTSVENPLPSLVPYDFEKADEVKEWNFATGVNGEPIDYDPAVSPHLLIVGGTGGGKSVLAQAILYGVAINHSDIYIIDPVKGAADFKFLEPYVKAIATTINDAAVVMKHVYSIVTDRVKINAAYSVGNYRDLPEEIRPPHIVVMVDEFVSLIETSKVEKQPFDDPEMEQDRQVRLKDNNDRIAIGTYVGKIAREARSAGITVILATQKLTADNLASIPSGSTLKTNLARILLGNTNQWDRMAALRQPDAAPDLGSPIPKGRGLWESVETMPVVMQVWYATAVEYLEEITKRLTPLTDDEKIDLSSMKKSVTPLDFSVQATEEGDVIEDVGEFTFSLDEDEETPGEDTTPETAMTSEDFIIDDPTPDGVEIDDGWNVFSTPEEVEPEAEQIRKPEQVVGSVVGDGDDDFAGWSTPQTHTWDG